MSGWLGVAMADDDANDDLLDEVSKDEIAARPSDAGDPPSLVQAKLPEDVLARYEVYSYRGAAVLLAESHREQFEELMEALRRFRITTRMIRMAGGNESDIPKLFSQSLRPLGWDETVIQGDLLVHLHWKEKVLTKKGKLKSEKQKREIRREKFLDGHKVDYVKGKVAFDLEWNSKDQTFDRDLFAFNAFAQCGVIDVAVLVTRSETLNSVFREAGPALKKDGSVERKTNGKERMTHEKYGASTTWMGKLLYRLNAGRNGACPVLAIGITPQCIEDSNDDVV